MFERLELFLADEFNALLNNHQLHGEYEQCRSINITGDFRLIFKVQAKGEYLLTTIRTHHQLFGL